MPVSPATAPPLLFVVPAARSLPLDSLRALDVRADWRELGHGEYSWCLQTFLELRDRGWPVELAHVPRPDRVNLVHVGHMTTVKPPADAFIVAVQADYPHVGWAQAHVVQNRRQEKSKGSFWVPHWPQPGIVPRSPDRGDSVRCVAYAGVGCWLAGGERPWAIAIEKLGIEFRRLRPENWNDYSTVDVLSAIRSFGRTRHDTKPPSKLFNAWHAGIPLVAGYDSAFEQVGRPGVDYCRVAAMEEAIEAIRPLRDDPAYYRSIVTAGAAR